MPYASVSELPAPVKTKLKGKKLRQWMHVFNSAFKEHQSESIASASAWAAVRKGQEGFTKGTAGMTDFRFFLPIAKIDQEKRTVSGYASTPTKDSDGEIVSLDAIKMALPSYLEYGNIREMHALKAVGVAAETNVDKKGLFLTAYISDDQAWKKCLPVKMADGTEIPATYKGFSIGGRKIDKEGDTITEIELSEISIVDRPANPDCRILIAKSAKKAEEAEAGGYLIKLKKLSPEKKALVKMARIIETLAKEGPPAAHDGFSLPALKEANASPKDPSVENNKGVDDSAPCEAHGKIGCKACLEKREFDQAKRTELAASGKAMPDGSFPIENEKDLANAVRLYGHAKDPAKAKAHIKARAKAIGAEGSLPEEWGEVKPKSAKKLAKAELEAAFALEGPSFLTLRKGMNVVGDLSYAFDSIRRSQRSLMIEGKREGGDKKDQSLGSKLGSVAKDLADVISQKASHEGEEALSLTDADDSYLNSILGENDMDKVVGSGDPILDAINNLVKRAAMPSRKAVMDSAKDDCSKSRKAMKECRKAVEEVHKMLKASYIAKMEKVKKDSKADSDGDFDHAGAMSKLQEAFGKAEEARTFGKAAMAKMEKAEGMSGRAGQRGQEAGDAEAGFYEVPQGVKDLSPSDMATASPGGRESGGTPPAYPVDGGVYPGKAEGTFDLKKYADKDGRVPAHIAELVMQGARNAGELEALRNMSRTGLAGGRRPVAFDMGKAFGGTDGQQPRHSPMELNKALFEGVDANAIGSGDENAHKAASARVIGNLLTQPGLFGKSILSPDFRGMAGQGRSSN